MTSKPASWFDEQAKPKTRKWISIKTREVKLMPLKRKYQGTELMSAIGEVIYTNVKINGKTKRVMVWKP